MMARVLWPVHSRVVPFVLRLARSRGPGPKGSFVADPRVLD